MLASFLLYNKVIQLYIYLFLMTFSMEKKEKMNFCSEMLFSIDTALKV